MDQGVDALALLRIGDRGGDGAHLGLDVRHAGGEVGFRQGRRRRVEDLHARQLRPGEGRRLRHLGKPWRAGWFQGKGMLQALGLLRIGAQLDTGQHAR